MYIFLLLLFIIAGCQRTLNWDLTSRGTLKDAQGICYPANVTGTFYEGIAPGKDTAYIELTVNVFTPGNYTIATDSQNGLMFTDAGSFSEAGIHVIKLKPSGKPQKVASSLFRVSFDTSVCSLSIDIKDTTTLRDSLNTWRYMNAQTKQQYYGTINATHFIASPNSNLLSLRHEITNPSDTTFDISIVYQGAVPTGVYKTDSLNNFAYSSKGICVNCAWNVAFQLFGALTTIVVTDYDPQSKIIRGTFSGTTIDSVNNIIPVKNGAFYAQVK